MIYLILLSILHIHKGWDVENQGAAVPKRGETLVEESRIPVRSQLDSGQTEPETPCAFWQLLERNRT